MMVRLPWIVIVVVGLSACERPSAESGGRESEPAALVPPDLAVDCLEAGTQACVAHNNMSRVWCREKSKPPCRKRMRVVCAQRSFAQCVSTGKAEPQCRSESNATCDAVVARLYVVPRPDGTKRDCTDSADCREDELCQGSICLPRQ